MFDKLIGNNPIKESLRRLIKKDHVPHSVLFVGRNGTGKKQFALELARAFVCSAPNENEPCGKCSSCARAGNFKLPTSGKKEDYERVQFSEHPDVGIVIPNKQTIYINAIRNLELEANFRPYEAKARVFVVDEAEKMNPQASNALLKTLEEPSDTTYIFLITSRPASLLPTIRSRCQMIRFAPIDENEIKSFLFSKHNIPTDDSKLIANLARGSVGDALNIDLESFLKRRKKMIEVLECLIQQNHHSILLKTTEELIDAKNKDNYLDNLNLLQTLIRDLWTLSRNPIADNLVNIDLKRPLTDLASIAKDSDLQSWIVEIENLKKNLNFNLNRKIATDALFMKMSN